MFVRIKFSKTGAIRYIGHLDVMRYFQKCIRRAELDVAYTGGFSPHQIMTFASPLGVGLESYGEYMDVKFVTDIPCEEIQSRLNAVSVPEIRILDGDSPSYEHCGVRFDFRRLRHMGDETLDIPNYGCMISSDDFRILTLGDAALDAPGLAEWIGEKTAEQLGFE